MDDSDGPIAIVHDYFDIRGGGERLVLRAADALRAELYCGFRTSQSYDAALYPGRTIDLGLPSLLRLPGLRVPALAWRFSRLRRALERYRMRIFSGVTAPFAAPDPIVGRRNIFYCHTPPRFLYDQRERYVVRSPLQRSMLVWYKRGFEEAVGRMDAIVANSRTVQQRIKNYLGRDSAVIYPPCDIAAFRWRAQGDYYLSTARVSSLKRVDRIVEAFVGMPEKRLIVVSGGSELAAIRRLAADSPNIDIRGWIDDPTMQDLVGNAIATIYAPIEEDFGISPVESMAAGKPVIGVAEGGLTETVIDGETGVLMPPGFTVETLRDGVRAMTPMRAATMRAACEARAAEFSTERFVASLRAFVGT